MEVMLLEEKEDGYQIYRVTLPPDKVETLKEFMKVYEIESLTDALTSVIEVGMDS